MSTNNANDLPAADSNNDSSRTESIQPQVTNRSNDRARRKKRRYGPSRLTPPTSDEDEENEEKEGEEEYYEDKYYVVPAVGDDGEGQDDNVDEHAATDEGYVPSDRACTPPEQFSLPTSISKSTPMSHKRSGTDQFSSIPLRETNVRRVSLAGECRGKFIVGMSPEEFFSKLLPVLPDGMPPTNDAFKGVYHPLEKDVYKPFAEAIKPFCNGFDPVVTSDSPDPVCNLKVDMAIYNPNLPRRQLTDFSRMEIGGGFKSRATSDAFLHQPSKGREGTVGIGAWEGDSADSRETRGQLAGYAAAQMGLQPRNHLFSFEVCGEYGRLIYWDRAAAIVTAPFDYTKQPEIFAQFFWRYTKADKETRGYDVSVKPVTDDAHVALGKKHLGDNGPYFIMQVPSREDENQFEDYIVTKPKFQARSPFGRATQSFKAWSIKDSRLVSLKNCWRVNSLGILKEGEVYRRLDKHGVSNIAEFDRGNDVNGVRTRTNLYVNEKVCPVKKLDDLSLYRMTTVYIDRHITQFKSTREYVSAIADAMQAHSEAYYKAGLLHRDISAGNIRIEASGIGKLIDWDMYFDLWNPLPNPRRADRTGTWQFISANLLLDPNKHHDLLDDRESCYHLLVWLSLLYTPSNQGPLNLHTRLSAFDECAPSEDGPVGGGKKKLAFLSKSIDDVRFAGRKNLEELLSELSSAFEAVYVTPSNAIIRRARKSDYLESWTMARAEELEAMKIPEWPVSVIRRYLGGPGWPTNDAAKKQRVNSDPFQSERKRDSETAQLENYSTSSRKSRKESGNGNGAKGK